MASSRVTTSLLGRIITKHTNIPPGHPSWPVDDPMVFFSGGSEHKAEIVAVFLDSADRLRLTCRTLVRGQLFNIFATDGAHTIDSGSRP